MNTIALIWLVVVQASVTLITVYLLLKVLSTKHNNNENGDTQQDNSDSEDLRSSQLH